MTALVSTLDNTSAFYRNYEEKVTKLTSHYNSFLLSSVLHETRELGMPICRSWNRLKYFVKVLTPPQQ